MSDLKLFRLGADVEEISSSSMTIEKSLQVLFEKHLDKLLGVRFLATEYRTGKTHAGRIDTLGIDENNCPVIIEYKRSMNQNVINQGLFYLDWLMDHQAEFKLLVMEKYGNHLAQEIEWSMPRLICIAGDFTKYDEYAVQQINRNISLIRYKKYGDDLLLLELMNTTSVQNEMTNAEDTIKVKTTYKTAKELLSQAEQSIQERFESLKSYILSIGDDVGFNVLKSYFAFKRIRNFACVQVHPQSKSITLWLRLDPSKVELEAGFSRDVSQIGHHGTGDLEIIISSDEDLEKAKPYIEQSYERS